VACYINSEQYVNSSTEYRMRNTNTECFDGDYGTLSSFVEFSSIEGGCTTINFVSNSKSKIH
jgi:hypothetical protein